MKKALRKDFWMEIKKTANRFISICLIVALGVAFYAGVRAAHPDMELSADTLYDDSHLMDLRVVSTLGLTDEDVDAIKQIPEIEDVMPSYFTDVIYPWSQKEMVLRMISAPDSLNQITVQEGRMPKAEDECLVDRLFVEQTGAKIGDTLQVQEEGEKRNLTGTTFKIVGVGTSAYYIAFDRETSKIGNGTVDSFIILPKSTFQMEAYPQIYASVKGAIEYNTYSTGYKKLVESVGKKVEKIADARCEIRYENLLTKGQQAIEEAKTKVEEGESKLADGKSQLESSEAELKEGEESLTQKEDELKEAKDQIEKGTTQLLNGKDQLDQGNLALLTGRDQLEAGKTELSSGQGTFAQMESTLQESKILLTNARDEWNSKKAQLEQGLSQIADGQNQLDEKKVELEVGGQQLSQLSTTLEFAKGQVAQGEEQLTVVKDSLSTHKGQLEVLEDQWQASQDQELEEQIIALKEIIAQEEQGVQMLETQLEQGRDNIKTLQDKFDTAQTTFTQSEALIIQKQEEINKASIEAKEQGEALNQGDQELTTKEGAYQSGLVQFEEAKEKLLSYAETVKQGEEELTQKETLLREKEGEWQSAKETLDEGKKQLENGEIQLEAAKETLDEGRQKLEEGHATYEEEERENLPKLEQAKMDIQDGEEKLQTLEKPQWYVLDRNSIQSYVEYGENAKRVGAIGLVFPLIFFVVAALVSLTTMTRMVEEQRTQIGTLKALGYGKGSIMSKYLFYALFAAVIGSGIGLVLGQKIFPTIIIKAYQILYKGLTVILTPMQPQHAITAAVAAIVCTVGAALLACYKELLGVPAQLMRPEPPKAGRRVFLERLPILWKHLSFTTKSTIRNLFRYKKRFFMTILGIGGCMSLILVGFGLKDSIKVIGRLQFQEVSSYQAKFTLTYSSDQKERDEFLKDLLEDPRIQSGILMEEQGMDLRFKGDKKSVYLVVPSKPEELERFITLRDRKTHEKYKLDEDGVIITEKLASLLHIRKGDTVSLEDENGKIIEVPVTAITEQYFNHYVYMTPKLYEQLMGKKAQYHQILTIDKEESKEFEEQLQKEYLERDIVSNILMSSQLASSIDDMLGSLDLVIYVLVISAGMLAFIVLYNLNNVNVSERIRELATLKVLGFYDKEVTAYVVRENIWLTGVGTVVGLVLGKLLHRFVVIMAETDMTMFGRDIFLPSYIYSILLTLLFSMIVNGAMYFQLKKINMVESMKSVE